MNSKLLFPLVVVLFQTLTGAAGLSTKFSKENWNNYKVGSAPDVKKDFSAPWNGCTGFVLGGKPCNPSVKNHAQVKKNPSGSDSVMNIQFKKGLYASQSGGQFYKDVSLGDSAALDYEVYFPKGFQWRKGGKLPGLYGGNKQCSGSKVLPNGKNCFSTRLMWRENGVGEVYMYLPFKENQDSFCKRCAYPVGKSCKSLSGAEYCAWSRGSFRFQAGSWNKIREVVKLNTPGKANGSFELYVNGKKVAAHSNVVFRTTSSMKISGMLFSTFFGGDSKSYAPLSDQELNFRSIKISG